MAMLTATLDKKKRAPHGQMNNKLEEIDKPRGFDRNLPIERILGATDCKGDLLFLVQWLGCDEYDLLPVAEINERDPASVIAYYEERSSIVRRCEARAAAKAQIDRDLADPQRRAMVVAEVVGESVEMEETTVNTEEGAGEGEITESVQEESVPEVSADVQMPEEEEVEGEAAGVVEELATTVEEAEVPTEPIPDDIQIPM